MAEQEKYFMASPHKPEGPAALLAHLALMQTRAAAFIEPTPEYISLDGQSSRAGSDPNPDLIGMEAAQRNHLFGLDMVYLLDGPEQRYAQEQASFNFVAESMVTCSGGFHGDKVSISELLTALQDFSSAAERLDRIKKALFYGRDYIPNPTGPSPSRPDEDNMAYPIIERIAETLTLNNGDKPGFFGQEPHSEDKVVKLAELAFHAIIGVATEAGEMVDAWLDAYKHNKPVDLVNLKEEFGDNQWYVAIFLHAFGQLVGIQQPDFDSLHRGVNRKLRARFPAGFTEYDANNRDLVKERAILEGDTFDAEQVAAGSQMRGQPVEPPFACKPLEFPDEPHSGVDLAPGKLSDKS